MTQDAFPSLGATTSPNLVVASSVPLAQNTPSWGRRLHDSNFMPKVEKAEQLSSSPGQVSIRGKKPKNKEKILSLLDGWTTGRGLKT
jgi:hypothetical protein